MNSSNAIERREDNIRRDEETLAALSFTLPESKERQRQFASNSSTTKRGNNYYLI